MSEIKPNTCAHCNKPFSCGCQKITALDGKTVHKTCKPDYDLKIINKK
jgi:hypothetical protein